MIPPEDQRDRPDLTLVLRGLGQGDASARATLLPYVYDELRAIAAAYLRTQRASHTLSPTALVSEAYLKLFGGADVDLSDRKHFFALAARAMRQLLVDHARARGRDKRGGGGRAVTLDEVVVGVDRAAADWLDLDLALAELAELDGRQAQIVELRTFGGYEMADIAEALGVSKSTVEREWRSARAWLGVRLDVQGRS